MEREAKHQQDKRAMRLMEAIANNVPVDPKHLAGCVRKPAEHCNTILEFIVPRSHGGTCYTPTEIAQLYRANEARLAATRAKDAQGRQRAFKPRTALQPGELHGKRVLWVTSSGQPCGSVSHLNLQYAPAGTWPRECDFLVMADLSVVMQNVLLLWRLALLGGRVVNLEYLQSDGNRGASLTFTPGVHKQRLVWTSVDWAEQNPDLWEDLNHSVFAQGSRWKWFNGSNVEFVSACVSKNKRHEHLCGILTGEESAQMPAQLSEKMFQTSAFISACLQLSQHRDTVQNALQC
eukprot:6491804-Amphidinium_carterae.1